MRYGSERERHGTGTGNHGIFRSRPRVPDPSRSWFLFPPSTIPPYGVLFPFRLFSVPILSTQFPTVSRPSVCPVVPIPSRRSHTVSPIPHLTIEAVIPIPFTTDFLVSPSYVRGCNWIMQLSMQQYSRRGDWRLPVQINPFSLPPPLQSPTYHAVYNAEYQPFNRLNSQLAYL